MSRRRASGRRLEQEVESYLQTPGGLHPGSGEGASLATLYRSAVRESRDEQLRRALGEIKAATHAVVGRYGSHQSRVYHYGDLPSCQAFHRGLERDTVVVPVDAELRRRLSDDRKRAYLR